MTKITRKITIATALLCGALLTGVGLDNINSVSAETEQTSTPATTFEIKSASLRIPDATYGEGIRFTVIMDADTYKNKNVANLTSGALIIPTAALGENEELTIDSTNSAKKTVEGVSWTESADSSVMQMYIHVYNIPETEYATSLSICAYVDDGDSTTEPMYTSVVTSSVAEVADWCYDNDDLTDAEKTTLQESYLTYDVYFHDGDNMTSATGIYGETISAPTAPEKEGYTFDGWWNKAQTAQWDFNTTTIGGVKTNLYAKWTKNSNTVTTEITGYTLSTTDTHVSVTNGEGELHCGNADGTNNLTFTNEVAAVYNKSYATNTATFKLDIPNASEYDTIKIVIYLCPIGGDTLTVAMGGESVSATGWGEVELTFSAENYNDGLLTLTKGWGHRSGFKIVSIEGTKTPMTEITGYTLSTTDTHVSVTNGEGELHCGNADGTNNLTFTNEVAAVYNKSYATNTATFKLDIPNASEYDTIKIVIYLCPIGGDTLTVAMGGESVSATGWGEVELTFSAENYNDGLLTLTKGWGHRSGFKIVSIKGTPKV